METLGDIIKKHKTAKFVSWQSEDGKKTVSHVKGFTLNAEFPIPKDGKIFIDGKEKK